jgi:hypothetical protein
VSQPSVFHCTPEYAAERCLHDGDTVEIVGRLPGGREVRALFTVAIDHPPPPKPKPKPKPAGLFDDEPQGPYQSGA